VHAEKYLGYRDFLPQIQLNPLRWRIAGTPPRGGVPICDQRGSTSRQVRRSHETFWGQLHTGDIWLHDWSRRSSYRRSSLRNRLAFTATGTYQQNGGSHHRDPLSEASLPGLLDNLSIHYLSSARIATTPQ